MCKLLYLIINAVLLFGAVTIVGLKYTSYSECLVLNKSITWIHEHRIYDNIINVSNKGVSDVLYSHVRPSQLNISSFKYPILTKDTAYYDSIHINDTIYCYPNIIGVLYNTNNGAFAVVMDVINVISSLILFATAICVTL